MEIRPATLSDVPTLQRIVTAAYQKYVARIGKPPGPMRDDYAKHVSNKSVWIVEAYATALGFVVLIPGDGHLMLDNIAVNPARQGGGVGPVLMAFVEQEARSRGLTELRLYTHEKMTESLAMYPAWGWIETERREQDDYHRVFFRKSLS